jgi:hypothetical protein
MDKLIRIPVFPSPCPNCKHGIINDANGCCDQDLCGWWGHFEVYLSVVVVSYLIRKMRLPQWLLDAHQVDIERQWLDQHELSIDTEEVIFVDEDEMEFDPIRDGWVGRDGLP